MPPSLQLDHVAFPVADAQATLDFYRDLLQLPLLAAHSGDDWGGHPWLMMIFGLGDGRQLALTALAGANFAREQLPRDTRHIAFSVASLAEWTAWRTRVQSAGIEHWHEDHGSQQSLYFIDPGGNVLEVTTPASALVSPPAPSAEAAATIASWLLAHAAAKTKT